MKIVLQKTHYLNDKSGIVVYYLTEDGKETGNYLYERDLQFYVDGATASGHEVIVNDFFIRSIPESVLDRAEQLSSQWDNMCWVVEDKDGTFWAAVWNKYKDELKNLNTVASVDYYGWRVKDGYSIDENRKLFIN